MMSTTSELPLCGLRILKFTSAVMGPTAGLLLAEIGYSADDIRKLQVAGKRV
jgi:crotonobetainyl-CoA:carnitine CoA-transferase CaiB-like acyl-CoA transferase